MCTFNCSTMSDPDGPCRIISDTRDMHTHEIYFCSIFLRAAKGMRIYVWELEMFTSGGYGTYSSDSLVGSTGVRSDMPIDIYCKCEDVKNMYIW